MTWPRQVVTIVVVAAVAGVAQTFGRFTYSLLFTDVRDDLGISNTLAGTVGTLNLVAYLTATLIVSLVVSRFGLTVVTRTGIAVSAAGIALLAWAPNLGVLIAGQIVTGLGGAAVWVTVPGIAAATLGPDRRGLAIGSAGAGLGVAVVIASTIESRVGTNEWRTVYRIELVAALVILVLAFIVLPMIRPAPVGERPTGLAVLRQVPGWRAMFLSYSLYGLTVGLFINFLVASLEDDSGYTAAQAATAFSAFGVGTIFGGPVLGPLSDRAGRRVALALAFALLVVASLIIPTGAKPWSVVAAFLFGLGFSATPTGVAARITDHVDATGFGAAFGIATLGFGGALMTGPQLGGLIGDATNSFAPVFYLAATASAAGGVLAVRR